VSARALPRLVIAAPHSGSGKTTVTLGLLAALRRRGLAVQPFKAGPDFIDPSHHTAICGRVSRNLDTWMCDDATVAEIFARSARDADLSVVEGVMGLYDGFGPDEERGSTAHLAKLLSAPVLLVIDAQRMATTAAAVALGLAQFDRRVTLAGVVFNNVGGEGHYAWLRQALRDRAGLASFGYLSHDPGLGIEERHLGLVPAAERGPGADVRARLRAQFDAHVDVDAVVAAARAAPPAAAPPPAVFGARPGGAPVRIGVVRDAALNFYYQENLDLLECCGAETVPFSVLDDDRPPRDVRGLYLGGGFPELFAARIAANRSMRDSIRDFFAAGGAIYAECGGLMILCEALVDLDGRRHGMYGLVPAVSVMRRDRLSLGYVEAEVLADTLIARAGERYRAQTFHHSVLEEQRFTPALKLYHGAKDSLDGYAQGKLLATYVHAHFAARPALARRFVERCRAAAPAAH
jgi:cobyrinic acid a,c-diamide synthase